MRKKIFLATVALAGLVVTSGYTTAGLVTEKGYGTSVIEKPDVIVPHVWAEEKYGKFFVKGQVKKTAVAHEVAPKAIKVELVSLDGTVLSSKQVSHVPRIPKNRSCRQTGRFTVEFSEAPAPGSSIRVAVVD